MTTPKHNQRSKRIPPAKTSTPVATPSSTTKNTTLEPPNAPANYSPGKIGDQSFNAPAAPPAKKKTTAPAQPTMVSEPFNLSSALQQVDAPTLTALAQLFGQAQGGQAQSPQAATNAALPGLNEYLANVPANMRGEVGQGLQNQVGALAQMPTDVSNQIANAGQAGLLTDLLNAAKYQAVYKQALYGTPPSQNTPLGQLYNSVVQGGNQLSGTLSAVSPTSPTSPTNTPAAPNLNG